MPGRSALVLGIVAMACSATPDPAREIESHLYAPCCWRQVLADHESPLATRMRVEIRERLAAGETPDAIERGFVERYGDRISAVGTRGPGPGVMIGAVTASSALVGLWVLGRVMRRRRRAAYARAVAPTLVVEEDALADRLDEELAGID